MEGLDPKYVDSLSIEALIYPEKLNFWDNGEGFDISILKTLGRNKLHGRGIKMMKSIADAVFYNKQRNGVNIYLKKGGVLNRLK